jgi:hypothetical protein
MSGQAGPPPGGPQRDDDEGERGRDKRARGREGKGEEDESVWEEQRKRRKGAWVFDRGKQPG